MLHCNDFTVKEKSQVKSDTNKRSAAQGQKGHLKHTELIFAELYIPLELLICEIRALLCCADMKEQLKVKSDTTKSFTVYGFLEVDCTLQTNSTNNKQDTTTFILNHCRLTMKERSKVKSDTTKD